MLVTNRIKRSKVFCSKLFFDSKKYIIFVSIKGEILGNRLKTSENLY